MLTVAGPPTNEAGDGTLPERTMFSVPSTRRSSRISTITVKVLPSMAPTSNVTSVRDRVKS